MAFATFFFITRVRDKYIRDAPIEVKLKLIGSIFDGKIEFDGKSYRTNSYNKVLDLIYVQTNELRGGGKERGCVKIGAASFHNML